MKKLLIVVDYQNDFVCGALGFAGAEKLDAGIANRMDETRAQGGDVVFTFDTHSENYAATQEGKKLPIPHCMRGTKGHDLYGRTALAKRPYDRCFEKSTFGSLALADWLRGEDYSHIELAGLVSSICVLSNAILAKAALPEAEIIVDSRLVAGPDPLLHTKALEVLRGVQVTIL